MTVSEMCIRDRFQPLAGAEDWRGFQAPLRRLRAGGHGSAVKVRAERQRDNQAGAGAAVGAYHRADEADRQDVYKRQRQGSISGTPGCAKGG